MYRKSFILSLIHFNKFQSRQLSRATSSQRSFEEIRIPVPWGHIAGKWWRSSEQQQRPILAVHGLEDNCGTFDRLIPLINNGASVLAIDLPGHGHSSWYPPGMYYHFLDFVILTKYIKNYFKWAKISLMGHSYGGIVCYSYTTVFPDDVDYLICIEGVKPLIPKHFTKTMAKAIQQHIAYDQLSRSPNEPPSYPMHVLAEKLASNRQRSVHIDHCHHILKRNTTPSKSYPDQYYLTRDPKLKVRFMNWPQNELVENANRVTQPILIFKSLDSGYFEDKQNFYDVLEVLKKSSRDCQYHYVEGTHHLHLNNPEHISDFVNDFIGKYQVEDQTSEPTVLLKSDKFEYLNDV